MNKVEKNLSHLNLDLIDIVNQLSKYLNKDFNQANIIKNLLDIIYEGKYIEVGMKCEYLNKDDIEFIREIFSSRCLSLGEQKNFLKSKDISIINYRNELVKYSLWVPVIISLVYIDNGVSYMDLIQEGSLGIIEATKKYKKNNNKAYSTLLIDEIVYKIEKCIHMIGKYGNISKKTFKNIKIIKYLFDNSLSLLGHNANLEEIADILCIPNEEILHFLYLEQGSLSLEDTDLEDNHNRILNTSMEEEIENKLYFEQLLEICTSVLNERELFVLKSTYGINSNHLTQKQIGSILGCSYQNVAQIINKSLLKIKKEIKKRNNEFRNKQLRLLTIDDIKKMR